MVSCRFPAVSFISLNQPIGFKLEGYKNIGDAGMRGFTVNINDRIWLRINRQNFERDSDQQYEQ